MVSNISQTIFMSHTSEIRTSLCHSSAFADYQAQHDMPQVRAQLTAGLDPESCQYIACFEQFVQSSATTNPSQQQPPTLWTSLEFERFTQDRCRTSPMPNLNGMSLLSGSQPLSITCDCYDLSRLPAATLQKAQDKAILDGGLYLEQLLPVYHSLFGSSEVHTLEPAQLTDLDAHVSAQQLQVGLLRLNQQGSELEILQKSQHLLSKQRPILICAVYNTPQTFYELKPYIESLNLGYRFALRRSLLGPTGELMLVAYA